MQAEDVDVGVSRTVTRWRHRDPTDAVITRWAANEEPDSAAVAERQADGITLVAVTHRDDEQVRVATLMRTFAGDAISVAPVSGGG